MGLGNQAHDGEGAMPRPITAPYGAPWQGAIPQRVRIPLGTAP